MEQKDPTKINYAPNSRVAKTEQAREASTKKVEKVITGPVTVKKKSEIRKFTDVFFASSMEDVTNYLVHDLIVPAVKNTTLDGIINVASMLFFGTTRGRDGRSYSSRADRVSYDQSYRRYDDRRYDDRRYDDRRDDNRRGYFEQDICFRYREDADRVLRHLDDVMREYKLVSVADLNEALGVTGEYTDHDYGWTSLHTARVDNTREGYVLRLPKAMPIEK